MSLAPISQVRATGALGSLLVLHPANSAITQKIIILPEEVSKFSCNSCVKLINGGNFTKSDAKNKHFKLIN